MDICKFVEIRGHTAHVREYQRMRRKFNYESLLHGEEQRRGGERKEEGEGGGGGMFGEISRTGEDRLNVKGENERIGYGRSS